MVVIAPGKTPRGPWDRVKTDQKDAEPRRRPLKLSELALDERWGPTVARLRSNARR